MNWSTQESRSGFSAKTSVKYDRSKLRALIDEATTDSNDESDEHAGLLGMIREEVACPFRARLQGEDVRMHSLRVA